MNHCNEVKMMKRQMYAAWPSPVSWDDIPEKQEIKRTWARYTMLSPVNNWFNSFPRAVLLCLVWVSSTKSVCITIRKTESLCLLYWLNKYEVHVVLETQFQPMFLFACSAYEMVMKLDGEWKKMSRAYLKFRQSWCAPLRKW